MGYECSSLAPVSCRGRGRRAAAEVQLTMRLHTLFLFAPTSMRTRGTRTGGKKPGPYVSCHIHDCRACFYILNWVESTTQQRPEHPAPRGGGARRDTVQSCAHPIVVHTPRMCKYASLSFTPVTPPLVVGIETVLGAERLCPSPLPCRQRSLPIFSQPGVRTHLPQILRGPCVGPL